MDNFSGMTIKELAKGLADKKFLAIDLTNYFIDRIKKDNKDLFAFLEITEEMATDQAREVDKKIAKGDVVSPLAGIPMAIKDNMLIGGVKCTSGSKILENYISPYDATVIKKLKTAGAIFLGKTNMDEFAMGSSTENSAFGVTKNPLNKKLVPGGSSGGSAAAVAGGLCIGALGSDTGGSIRQPASFCGVVGFKPTYGSVSRYGLMAMASSLDQIGPLAKNLDDAEIIFETITGKDFMDSTSIDVKRVGRVCDISGLRIGIPREYFIDGMDKDVGKNVRKAISLLEKEGFEIQEVSLPHTEYALAVYYIIMPSEVSANLARFDGIKYGYSTKDDNLSDVYIKSRERGFGLEPKRRIILGSYVLSSGYYDAYYKKAQKARALIKKDFDEVFKQVDVLITPTSPTYPFKIGEKTGDPLSMYLSDVFTVTANLAGLPAISMPFKRGPEMPVGIQVIGKAFDEKKVLEACRVFEKIWK